MKKILLLLLSILTTLSMFGCGSNQSADLTDMEYVKEKGTLVVGITEFAPMDFKDKNGDWVGFDS